jgi:hypothetical protein
MKVVWLASGCKVLVVSLALVGGAAHAEKTLGAWKPVFQGIDTLTGSETGVFYPGETGTRSLAINAMRITLTDPGIRFFTTPGNGAAPLETRSQTTGDFLEAHDLQAAINANFFAPCCSTSAEDKDVIGLAISQGELVSPADTPSNALALTRDNRATIGTFGADADLSSVYNAVTGGDLLVRAGAVGVGAVPANSFADKNPRTAVGLSADGSFLYLMTIDGRQPGYSDGATLFETAGWLLELGVYDGLNLDGGGSTSMTLAGAGGDAQYLNRVSGGAPRLNGNNFGIYAAALPVPEPSSYALLFAGLLAIAAVQRRRGR